MIHQIKGDSSRMPDLDDRNIRMHFHENDDCGSMGPVTSKLMEWQGGRCFSNVHIQLLSIIKYASLEDIIKAHREVNSDIDDFVYRINIKTINHDRFPERCKDFPFHRIIVKGDEGTDNCCDLVENLFGCILINTLKDVARQRGFRLESKWGLKINDWWNYREDINNQVSWKYRFACQ